VFLEAEIAGRQIFLGLLILIVTKDFETFFIICPIGSFNFAHPRVGTEILLNMTKKI
jgi:hypothetical protein